MSSKGTHSLTFGLLCRLWTFYLTSSSSSFSSFLIVDNRITSSKRNVHHLKMPIQKIHARQIFDSRGNPTVEVDLTTELGLFLSFVSHFDCQPINCLFLSYLQDCFVPPFQVVPRPASMKPLNYVTMIRVNIMESQC